MGLRDSSPESTARGPWADRHPSGRKARGLVMVQRKEAELVGQWLLEGGLAGAAGRSSAGQGWRGKAAPHGRPESVASGGE